MKLKMSFTLFAGFLLISASGLYTLKVNDTSRDAVDIFVLLMQSVGIILGLNLGLSIIDYTISRKSIGVMPDKSAE